MLIGLFGGELELGVLANGALLTGIGLLGGCCLLAVGVGTTGLVLATGLAADALGLTGVLATGAGALMDLDGFGSTYDQGKNPDFPFSK